MVQTANELLKAFGLPARIFIGPELPPGLNATAVVPKTGHTLSRRAFFSMLTRRTTGVAAVAAAATVDSLFGSSQAALTIKKGELPAHVPAKRQLLLLALRRLSIPTTMSCMADRQLWVQFGFTEVCTGCQMCAFFCPTGALRKIQQDGQAGLAFRLSDCTNCRLCQDVCYKQAVTLSPAANLRAILDDAVDTFVMWDANTTPRHALGMDHQRRLVGH
jgi:ferredoxin